MAQFISQLRRRYPGVAKDLIAPFIEVIRLGRETCGGDLDSLLILLVIAMRTVEHKAIGGFDLDEILRGEVASFPSLTTNIRSVADSTGIPRESVRRKVAALVDAGLVRRERHSLALDPAASILLTGVREALMQLAVRNHQTVLALEPRQEG